MDNEMANLRENGVYELVDRPKGKKVVKSKWVFRVKTNEKGEIEKYKARVVAKGYSQVHVRYNASLARVMPTYIKRRSSAICSSSSSER